MALANYFVVFNRQALNAAAPNAETKFKKGKLLQNTAGHLSPEVARVCKLEAESVAEAQEIVGEAFPSNSTGTAVVVTEAQFKES